MIRLNKPNRNSGLYPLRTSLRHKTIGTILRREPTAGHRVLNSDVFAHGSRVVPRWDCEYARKEMKQGGSFRRLRLALAYRTEPFRLLYTPGIGEVSGCPLKFFLCGRDG